MAWKVLHYFPNARPTKRTPDEKPMGAFFGQVICGFSQVTQTVRWLMKKILAFDCCDELGHVWLWVGANVLDDSPPPDDFMCKCGCVAWKDRHLTKRAPDVWQSES